MVNRKKTQKKQTQSPNAQNAEEASQKRNSQNMTVAPNADTEYSALSKAEAMAAKNAEDIYKIGTVLQKLMEKIGPLADAYTEAQKQQTTNPTKDDPHYKNANPSGYKTLPQAPKEQQTGGLNLPPEIMGLITKAVEGLFSSGDEPPQDPLLGELLDAYKTDYKAGFTEFMQSRRAMMDLGAHVLQQVKEGKIKFESE